VHKDPQEDFEVPAGKEKKFRKTFETMKGLCHVMPITSLKRPNAGKDDDDYDLSSKQTILDKVALRQDFIQDLQFHPASIIAPLLHIHSCVICGMDNGTVTGESHLITK
jgi:hypothetical protein